MSIQTSRAWFPGNYVPVAHLAAVEILLTGSHRVEVAVSKGTVFHGTRAQILAAAHALLWAVTEADAAEAQPAQ